MHYKKIVKDVPIEDINSTVFYSVSDKDIHIIFAKQRFYFGNNLKDDDILFKLTFYYYDINNTIGFLSDDMNNILNIFNNNKKSKINYYYRLDDNIFVSDTAKELCKGMEYRTLYDVVSISCEIFKWVLSKLTICSLLYDPIICTRISTSNEHKNITNDAIEFDNTHFIKYLINKSLFMSINDYSQFDNSDVLVYLNETASQVLAKFYQWLYNDYRNTKLTLDRRLNMKPKTPTNE